MRMALYMLFATYGPILDVVHVRNSKMRGQAHVVFRDVQGSTQAMRALQGFDFFGRELVRASWSQSFQLSLGLLITTRIGYLVRQRPFQRVHQARRRLQATDGARAGDAAVALYGAFTLHHCPCNRIRAWQAAGACREWCKER